MSNAWVNRQIVAGLCELLVLDSEDGSNPRPSNIESRDMSLAEKIQRWAGLGGIEGVSEADGNQGIDNQDDPVDHSRLQSYFRTIHGSIAYEWFITQVQRQAAVQHLPAATGRHVHRTILDQLPVGRVSKYRPPEIHSVTFSTPLPVFTTKDCWHKNVKQMKEHVVLVLNGGNAWMTTVGEYVELAWRFNGPRFLEFLEHAMYSGGFESFPQKDCIGMSFFCATLLHFALAPETPSA